VNSLNSEKRPVLDFPLTWKDKTLILIATIPIMFMLLYIKITWSNIPEIIPTHFGFSGTPDAYGNKRSLFIIVVIAIMLHLLLAMLSKFPQYYNYPFQITEKNVEPLYKIGRQTMLLIDLEISFFLSVLTWQNVQAAMGKIQEINGGFLFLFLVVIFGTIILQIVKMNRVKE
jgi:uncharacterized membrane protein